ncbi:PhnD/SsuA/transferrin family substrate-binding protein [Phenylobacterium sp.]|uniref:PhnD/SsuA/transferrin family substrate-binding protein n=1 Tax=Phenylobacterium sp. TaxID=1871053 RepID=UPI0025FBA7F7|nr:PhnD/SsuA/transferrin family substrate-binding protein [Phenylobacterium sp.]
MRLAALALAVAVVFTAVGARAEPFRIAVTGAKAACAPLGGDAAVGERAYYDLLSKRLARPVLKCGYAGVADAAAGLARGEADMAWLDPAAFAPVRAQTRAILTVRGARESNRIAVVVAVRAANTARDAVALKGLSIGFGGRSPAGLATPQTVLAERGLPPASYSAKIDVDGDQAIAELRAGRVDAVAVHAAAWQRVCRMVSPKVPNPCADLRIVLKARPRAAEALVVRRDIPDELRYRLIGLHMPMHLEAPAAFAFATLRAKDAAEFQPAEADALILATLK